MIGFKFTTEYQPHLSMHTPNAQNVPSWVEAFRRVDEALQAREAARCMQMLFNAGLLTNTPVVPPIENQWM